jgi:hypothetical protein
MDKALHVLHGKLGIDAPELPLEQAHRLYVDKYRTALPLGAIQAMASLFKLNLPSVVATDEALIALAGAGGHDLSPSTTLQASA